MKLLAIILLYTNFEGLFKSCEFDSILNLKPKTVYDSVIYLRSAVLLERWDVIAPILEKTDPDSANPSYLPYILQYLINSPYDGRGSDFFKRALSLYSGVEDYITYMLGLYYLENNRIDSATSLLFKLKVQNRYLFYKLAREITSRLIQYREFNKFMVLRKKLGLNGKYFQYAYILSLKGTQKPYRPLLYRFLKKNPKSPYSVALIKYLDKYTPEFIPALYYARKYRRVVRVYEKYHPENDLLLRLYLKSLYKTRNYKKFTKTLKKKYKRLQDSDDSELFLMAGIAYLRMGKKNRALSMFLQGSRNDDIRNITEFFYTLFKNPELDKKWRKTLLAYKDNFDGFLLNFYSGLYFLVKGDSTNARHFLLNALSMSENPADRIKATYYLARMDDTIQIVDSLYLTYYNVRSGALKIDRTRNLILLFNNYYADYPLHQNSELFRWKVLFMLGGYRLVRREVGKNPRAMILAARMAEKEGLIGENVFYAVNLLPYVRAISNSAGLPLDFLKMYFPLKYLPKIERYSSLFGFDPLLFMSLTREESWFNNKAISPAGAIGLCQLMPYTAKKLAGDSIDISTTSLFNPDINIRLGSYYFSALMDTLGSVPLALAGYNAGPHRAKRWMKNLDEIEDLDIFVEFIPITETRGYIKRILRTRRIYGKMIGMGVKP